MPRKTKAKRDETPLLTPEKPTGRHPLLLVALVFAGATVYANAITDPFVFDDARQIVDNGRIQALGSSFYGHQPVTNLTFGINHALGGLSVAGYHVVNLAIHILAALTLYGIVRRTLTTQRLREAWGGSSVWVAFAVALLWLLHPLQTGSVSYISQRSESLMGLWYLLTLYCVLRGATTSRGTLWLVAAVVCCGLGMGSKAVMVTAPITVLLFDRIYLADSTAQLIKRRGFLYLALMATWLVPVATGLVREVLDPTNTAATVGFGVRGITPVEYAMTQPGVVLHYLKLSLWPQSLCINYHWRPVTTLTESGAVPIVIVLALLLWTILAVVRRPMVGFIGVWFFLVLAPTSSFVPLSEPLAEQRMYLQLIAVVLVGVLGIRALLADMLGRKSSARGVLAAILLLFVAGPLAYGTIQRNQDYSDPMALWESVATQRPNNPRPYYEIGKILHDHGAFAEAAPALEQAIELDANHADAHVLLGLSYSKQNRHREAFDTLLRTTQLGRVDANVLAHLGISSSVLGEGDRAIEYYRQALELQPDFVLALYHYGNALLNADRADVALKPLERVIELNPDHIATYKTLAIVLVKVGRDQDALDLCNKALQLWPGEEELVVQKNLFLERLRAQSDGS